MKKFMSKFSEEGCSCLFAMFFFIPVVLFVIGLVLYIPIDYIKYKRSLYYKKEHKKYSLFIGNSSNFIFYNIILKNNLPIDYFSNPLNEDFESGWFIYDDTLILLNDFYFSFDNEKNEWVCEEDDKLIITLDEYIEEDTNGVNTLLGKTVCNKAVVLTKSKKLDNVELAKSDERFLVYDKNMEEVICSFCVS